MILPNINSKKYGNRLDWEKLLEQTENTNQINVQNLTKGIYMLEDFIDSKKITTKFIKRWIQLINLSIMKKLSILLFVVLIAVNLNSCSKDDSNSKNIKNPNLTDIDGNGYNTVNIGTQTWLQQNLSVSHYNNGDIIPQVTNATDWDNLKTGAWCYYENDTNKGKTYGKLYNWYAVNDPRGLAPKGYKTPSKNDWDVLIGYLGGASIAGGKMKSSNLWHSPNTGGTNSSGFSASPGGIYEYGVFKYVGDNGFWWSGTDDADDAYFVLLSFAFEKVQIGSYIKKDGLAVRCIKETI